MRIDVKLDKGFEAAFTDLKEEFGEEFASLNGLSDDFLNNTVFIDNFVDKASSGEDAVADVSIDGNANVGKKDIVALENEMSKPVSKLLNFNKIFYEMDKKYGYRNAYRWLREEWDGSFYLHDAYNSTFKPYCYSYDIERLVNEGLYFIANDFNNQPPKHLTTYTDFVAEFISWACNRSSGAVGLPSFLIYSYYFWKKDIQNNYIIHSPEYYRDQEFQRIIYKLNQPYLRSGSQSAFTNFSIFDKPYLTEIFGGKQFPDGSFIIDHIDEIREYQKAFMEVLSDVREANMMTFPVMTYALLYQDGKFVDEEFAKWCCAHNMKWADSNFFVSENINSLSNCCRLIADVGNLGYFNSVGGTALEVGSVKVNTINLARIAYESSTKEEYIATLRERTKLCLMVLDVIRGIMIRNKEKGLLPNYSLGVIDIGAQYVTIGINGLYEALQEFRMTYKDSLGYSHYTDEGLEFAEEILATIHEVKDEFAANRDYMVNIEQIPGERAASILMEKDKLLFPHKEYELPLYGNQWIPLGVKTSIAEKVKLSARLDKACSGGSIAHINIDAPFTEFSVAWETLNYIAAAGVQYFAYNLRISACENNHGFHGATCPVCGEPKVTSYQRIVGFLVPEHTYSKERKEEFKMRDWFSLNAMREI